jgi:hypothetical protein
LWDIFFGGGGYFGGKVDALIMWLVNIISITYFFGYCDYFGSW